MARRCCETCGRSIEGKRPAARFCSDTCRKRVARSPGSAAAAVIEDQGATEVADALRLEIETLGVGAMYEARIALGIASQLDNGTVLGAAYASLSKELDRRVEALRMKVERPDDPAKAVKERLAEKRLRLA